MKLDFVPRGEYLLKQLGRIGKLEKAIGNGEYFLTVGPINVQLARSHLDAVLGANHYAFLYNNTGVFYRMDFNVLTDECRAKLLLAEKEEDDDGGESKAIDAMEAGIAKAESDFGDGGQRLGPPGSPDYI